MVSAEKDRSSSSADVFARELPLLRLENATMESFCLQEAAARLSIPTWVSAGDGLPDSAEGTPWLRFSMRNHNFAHRGQLLLWQRPGEPYQPLNAPLVALLKNKQRTKDHLAAHGFPVPAGKLFPATGLSAAFEFAATLTGEVCVKPNQGSLGDLVFPALRTAEEIAEAVVSVAAFYDEMVIEESIPGSLWRLVYVEPEIVATRLGRPASVVGDGQSTVAELILARIAAGERRKIVWMEDCPSGHATDFMLSRQGLTYESVPTAGRRVFLHPAAGGMGPT